MFALYSICAFHTKKDNNPQARGISNNDVLKSNMKLVFFNTAIKAYPLLNSSNMAEKGKSNRLNMMHSICIKDAVSEHVTQKWF